MQDDAFKAGKPLTEEEFQSGVTGNKGGSYKQNFSGDIEISKDSFYFYEQLLWITKASSRGKIKGAATSIPTREIKTPIRTQTSNGRVDKFPTSYQALSVSSTNLLPRSFLFLAWIWFGFEISGWREKDNRFCYGRLPQKNLPSLRTPQNAKWLSQDHTEQRIPDWMVWLSWVRISLEKTD